MGFKDFFRSDSTLSSMRLNAFIVTVTACIVALGAVGGAVVGVILDRDLALIGGIIGGCAGLVGALLVPAFGGKAFQSFAEKKPDDSGEGVNNAEDSPK